MHNIWYLCVCIQLYSKGTLQVVCIPLPPSRLNAGPECTSKCIWSVCETEQNETRSLRVPLSSTIQKHVELTQAEYIYDTLPRLRLSIHTYK